MYDKVLAIIRETLLHDNFVEGIAIRLDEGQVIATFSQPNEKSSWPDHELRLTFEGVREFSASAAIIETRWMTLLGIECVQDVNGYRAEISIGEAGAKAWILRLRFDDLRFKRT